jgi:hypothetical protein
LNHLANLTGAGGQNIFQPQAPPTLQEVRALEEALRQTSITNKAQALQAGTGVNPVQSQAGAARTVPNAAKKFNPNNPKVGQELFRGGKTYVVEKIVDGKPKFSVRG